MDRERLGRCHATGLTGRCTTGGWRTGVEYDRAWLTGLDCSDVTGEILTVGMDFKSSVSPWGIAGLTSVALTIGWEDVAALPGVCGAPLRAKLEGVRLKYGGESAFDVSLPGWGPSSTSLGVATLSLRFSEERLPLLASSLYFVKEGDIACGGVKDPSIP